MGADFDMDRGGLEHISNLPIRQLDCQNSNFTLEADAGRGGGGGGRIGEERVDQLRRELDTLRSRLMDLETDIQLQPREAYKKPPAYNPS